MSNTVTIKNNKSIYINNTFVYTCSSVAKANEFKERLTVIFKDTSFDLDFITPTHYENSYAVCFARVMKNSGKTYFYNDAHPVVERRLYTPSLHKLYEIDSSVSAPWHEALKLANAIRNAATLNYDSVRETSKSSLLKLAVPTNTSSNVSKVISSSCSVQFYGHPDQGTEQGATSYSSSLGYRVENIAKPYCGNGDVLHPCDLTAAMTSTNGWSSTYKNKYVKVTNGSKSIVVRITDVAPAGKGIELTWRAYELLGKPQNAKIELMS